MRINKPRQHGLSVEFDNLRIGWNLDVASFAKSDNPVRVNNQSSFFDNFVPTHRHQTPTHKGNFPGWICMSCAKTNFELLQGQAFVDAFLLIGKFKSLFDIAAE